MALRLAYVTSQGWLDSITADDDIYDSLDGTLYFVRLHQPDVDVGGRYQVAAGMRLTPVTSFYESLTWSMLAHTPGAQKSISTDHLSTLAGLGRRAMQPDQGLWDVTRLVASIDDTVPKPLIIQSIYELLGMAMYKTVTAPHADPTWIFLTTASIKRLFDMSGIACQVLYSGRISADDDYECCLCIARPLSAYEGVEHSSSLTHRRAFRRVLDGCEALQAQDLSMTGT